MKSTLLAALAAAALLCATSASAQELRWHAGLAVADGLEDRGPFDADHTDSTRSLFAGATFDGGFGIEVAYVDLQDIDSIGIADAGFHLEGELWSVGATYGRRVGAFTPYAKLGWFTRDEDGVSVGIAGPRPLSISDDGVTAEVGARWHLGDAFALRAGYAYYDFETGGDAHGLLGAEVHF
jgi:opacity protein-like surface antigen